MVINIHIKTRERKESMHAKATKWKYIFRDKKIRLQSFLIMDVPIIITEQKTVTKNTEKKE